MLAQQSPNAHNPRQNFRNVYDWLCRPYAVGLHSKSTYFAHASGAASHERRLLGVACKPCFGA
jgi:hypothetical protein